MMDWFFQIMTLDQAYHLYENMNLVIKVEKGKIIVVEEG